VTLGFVNRQILLPPSDTCNYIMHVLVQSDIAGHYRERYDLRVASGQGECILRVTHSVSSPA